MDEFPKNPSEFSPPPNEAISRSGDVLPTGNEFDILEEHPDVSPFLEHGAGQETETKQNRKSRFQSKLLLQAAAVMVAAVAVTSSFGLDPLDADALFSGTELSSDILDDQLNNAGAKDGVITISMLWSTTDDMDLHVRTPSGEEIFYSNSVAAGGELDVDMQVGEPYAAHPVENIYFTAPQHGTYEVWIDNYNNRTDTDTKVLVRVKIAGRQTKEYYVMVGEDGAQVCTFTY